MLIENFKHKGSTVDAFNEMNKEEEANMGRGM